MDGWMDKWMMVQILFVTVDNRLCINTTVPDSFVVQMWATLAIFGSCVTVVNDGLSQLPHMVFMTEKPDEIHSPSEVSSSISVNLSANQRGSITKELYSFLLCVNPQQPGSYHIQPPAPSAVFTKRPGKLPPCFSSVCVLILPADCLVVFVRVWWQN